MAAPPDNIGAQLKANHNMAAPPDIGAQLKASAAEEYEIQFLHDVAQYTKALAGQRAAVDEAATELAEFEAVTEPDDLVKHNEGLHDARSYFAKKTSDLQGLIKSDPRVLRATRRAAFRRPHKLPAVMPVFDDSAVNTLKNVQDFIQSLENLFNSEHFPETWTEEDGSISNEWTSALQKAFGVSPSASAIAFARDLAVRNVDWRTAVKEFTTRYQSGEQTWAPQTRLLAETQNDRSVANHISSFKFTVAQALLGPAAGADMQTLCSQHPIYNLLFYKSLRPDVQDHLLANNLLAPAEKNFAELCSAAAAAETSLLSTASLSSSSSPSKTGATAENKKKNDNESPNKMKRILCTTCNKKHAGGAKACRGENYSPKKRDSNRGRGRAGNSYKGNNNKDDQKPRPTGSCNGCGQFGHFAVNCPRRQQAANISSFRFDSARKRSRSRSPDQQAKGFTLTNSGTSKRVAFVSTRDQSSRNSPSSSSSNDLSCPVCGGTDPSHANGFNCPFIRD